MYPFQIKSIEQYHNDYSRSIEDPISFWKKISEWFVWQKAPTQIIDWNFEEPKINWYQDAQLNITENCLDRWVHTQPHATALIWEPNNPDEATQRYTYEQLLDAVMKTACMLKAQGAKKGDRICIYMPMVPELAIAVLACARIGAIHSVVFGGFSAQSIADRINDASCNIIITADGAYRGTKEIALKATIDEALQQCSTVQKVIVYKRTGCDANMVSPRDVWWHEALEKEASVGNVFCKAETMNAEDPLFILYTSGSTGKPKGVVHTCAGYMVYSTYSFVNVFQYSAPDVFFCTADIGWITGHSYVVYSPLCAGGTSLLFEGIPTHPSPARFWEIVEKHQVNILYTAPTAIRSLMAFGTAPFIGKNLDSLKVLGTVGEPINTEAWHWYHTHVGQARCPIVDTWWQTETGGILISNLAGVTPHKPAHATLPLPGVQVLLVDEHGNEVEGGNAAKNILPTETVQGNLCIQYPWPSILRTTYGDHERCRQTYFSTYNNLYFTGDGCMRDSEGNYRITGRVDDVLNVSGHRIGTAEVENAINTHQDVIESAIVGYPHDVKGQGIYAYIILQAAAAAKDNTILQAEILAAVTKQIGAIAKPDKIQFVHGLPKTRSGKIMRRILRKVAEGDVSNLGDTSTLLDPTVVTNILEGRL